MNGRRNDQRTSMPLVVNQSCKSMSMADYFIKRAALSYYSAPFFTSALTLRLLRYGSRCLRYQLNVRILVGTSRKEFCLVGLIHEHIDDPSIGCMDSANVLCAIDTHVINFLKGGGFFISFHYSLCIFHLIDC